MQAIPLTLASGKAIRRAIIYIRVSTAREDMKSPEQQLAICQLYCVSKGIEMVGKPVEDLDLSGADFAKRKISSIIERVHAGEADAIVVWEYSRFGRTMVGSLFHIKQLEDAGGELLSATQDIDATTPSGRYMRDQFLRLAEYQLDTIREGWKSAHRHRLAKGLPHSGQPRFGYSRCPDCEKRDGERKYYCKSKCGGILLPEHLLPEGDRPAILRSVWLGKGFERIADGDSLYRFTQDARLAGVTSLRGNPMSEKAWQAVLDSGFGAGLLRGRTDKADRSTNTNPLSYDVWAEGAHEAVASPQAWDGYFEVRTKGYQKKGYRNTAPVYDTSGFVKCGEPCHDAAECHESMTVVHGGGTGNPEKYFRCTRKDKHLSGKASYISKKRLDAELYAWLAKSAQGEEIAQVSMERAAKAKASESEIPEVQKRIESLERKKARINEGYEAGLTSLDEAKARMSLTKVELEDAKARLRHLQAEAAAHSVPAKEVFQGLVTVWERAKPEERRKALRKIVDHICSRPPQISAWHGRSPVVVPLWADDSERALDRRFKRIAEAASGA